jgi:hypothetical protein
VIAQARHPLAAAAEPLLKATEAVRAHKDAVLALRTDLERFLAQ